MKEIKPLLIVLLKLTIGIAFFVLYIDHVRCTYYNRTKTYNVNGMKSEVLIRREDALYYSFYKTIVEEKDFWLGYSKLENYTDIEYPKQVNVINRFEVLPELVIGYTYHLVKKKLARYYLPSDCWTDNGNCKENANCELVIYPMEFYLVFVWFLGGITVLILFYYGSLLSKSKFGGLCTAASYCIFHKYTTKIYDRPMARENFASPFLFLQIYYTCLSIQKLALSKHLQHRILMMLRLAFLIGISLLTWKFTGIIFTFQLFFMMINVKINSTLSENLWNLFTFDFAIAQLLGMWLAYQLSYCNNQFLFGWQIGPCLSLAFNSVIRLIYPHKVYSTWQTVFSKLLLSTSLQISIFDFFEYINVLKPDDKAFLYYRNIIVQWLFDVKFNFASHLAACNPSYQSLQLTELFEIIKTLVLQPYCMYGSVMIWIFFWHMGKQFKTEILASFSDFTGTTTTEIVKDIKEINSKDLDPMPDVANADKISIIKQHQLKFSKCLKDIERLNTSDSNQMLVLQSLQKKDKNANPLQTLQNDEAFPLTPTDKNIPPRLRTSPKNIIYRSYHTQFNKELIANILNLNKVKKSATTKKDIQLNHLHQIKHHSHPHHEPHDHNNHQLPQYQQQQQHQHQHHQFEHFLTNHEQQYHSFFEVQLRHFHYAYSLMQMIFFTLLGVNIKKLFFLSFTEGCVLVPTFFSIFFRPQHKRTYWIIFLTICLLNIHFSDLLDEDVDENGRSSTLPKDDLESLLDWVDMNTAQNAVFAGPIDIIGTVHLTTRRPIVNHAHLEMPQISERIEHVYSVYSRHQSSYVYKQFAQMKVQYLIVNISECLSQTGSSCDILSIWDTLQPYYWKMPQLCSELLFKNVPSYLKVFSNQHYVIFKLFSQTVELNLRPYKMPEKSI